MQTDKLFTGQRAMASLGIYHYNARFYSPKLGRFLSADSIVPNPADPQHLNRFSYVANNPLKYIDPSGHKLSAFDGGGGSYKPAPKKRVGDNYCASHPWTCVGSKPTKPKGGGGGMGSSTPPPPTEPLWSTAQYKNEQLGESLADLSTRLQHAANFFSYLGGISEVGFTTAGLFGGGAAVGWVDLGSPVADVSGGLAGGVVGWEVGHGIHVLVTNPIESGVSSASSLTTYLSDIALGNTRIDVYESNITAVVGQPTATATALTLVGNANSVGIVDAAIDQIGSWYADGKIGGIYDLFGITGKKVNIGPYYVPLYVQFGDE